MVITQAWNQTADEMIVSLKRTLALQSPCSPLKFSAPISAVQVSLPLPYAAVPVIVHSEMRSVPCVQFGKHGAFCSESPESGSHGLISIYLNEPSLQQIGTSELVSLP